MTELSFAAQAVLDALCMEELNGPQQTMAVAHAAAALRAAADHVIPPDADYASNEVLMIALNVRHQFLAIADELEAQ